MANDPTIIIGSLNNEELKKNITDLVEAVKKGTEQMKSSFDSVVEGMKQKLQELSKTPIDVKTNVSEKSSLGKIKSEVRETAMTFDQIVEGLNKAKGAIRDFNIAREKSLPTKKDYLEYEQSLARVAMYNEKLKNSSMGLALANEKAFTFDA